MDDVSKTTVRSSVISFGPITLKRTVDGSIQIFVFTHGAQLTKGEATLLREWLIAETKETSND